MVVHHPEISLTMCLRRPHKRGAHNKGKSERALHSPDCDFSTSGSSLRSRQEVLAVRTPLNIFGNSFPLIQLVGSDVARSLLHTI